MASLSRDRTPFICSLIAVLIIATPLQLFLPPSSLEGKFLRGLVFIFAPLLFTTVTVLYGRKSIPLKLTFTTPWAYRLFITSLGIVLLGILTPLLAVWSGYIFYPEYFVSDLLKMLWILLAIVLLSFTNSKDEKWLYVALVTIGGVMLVITSGITPLSSGQQPHPLSIAVVVSLLLFEWERRGQSWRMVLLLGLTVMTVSQIPGAGRTKMLAGGAIVSAAVVIAFREYLLDQRQLLLSGFTLLIPWTALLLVWGVLIVDFQELLDGPNIGMSILRRLNEAQIALFGQSGWNILVGYGHGGVYNAPASVEIPRTATALGYVHPIHIGPVLLTFRYGLLGLAFYLLLILLTLVATVDLLQHGVLARKSANTKFSRPLFVISYFTLVGLLTKFHAQSSLIDPIFGLVIAIVGFGVALQPSLENKQLNR